MKHKSVGVSALDFFKEFEQSDELSLALPQSNSVVVALDRMDKRMKGGEEIPMTLLPSYPKCFNGGSCVALISKPRIFSLPLMKHYIQGVPRTLILLIL